MVIRALFSPGLSLNVQKIGKRTLGGFSEGTEEERSSPSSWKIIQKSIHEYIPLQATQEFLNLKTSEKKQNIDVSILMND